VIVRDWRLLPPSTVHALYTREQARWRRDLGWETQTTWATLEFARVTWGLPGFVCLDGDGEIHGWTFFLVRRQRIEIGGLVADTATVTDALIHAVIESAADAHTIGGFMYACAHDLEAALVRAGVSVERYAYLTRATKLAGADVEPLLTRGGAGPPALTTCHVRCWRDGDVDATATLLRDAYAGRGQLFAAGDSPAEWREYVGNLVGDTACGMLAPALSRIVVSDGGAQAAALVTTLGPATAHVAQLAVAPALRGRGVAAALITDVARSAHRSGYGRMSLLVSEENGPATRLYRRLGFGDAGAFVAMGTRQRPTATVCGPDATSISQPRRLSSVAWATDGLTTRR
jgi:ribosomal protein S18 acetylase RimI-like enzyme